MKKKLLILLIIIFIFVVIYSLTSPRSVKNDNLVVTSPTPTTSTITPNPTEFFEQLPNDLKYNQELTDIHQRYPWYSSLPLETEDYRIIYDFDKNSFRIRLLTGNSDSIKQAALKSLKEIGVDINKYPYYFLEP